MASLVTHEKLFMVKKLLLYLKLPDSLIIQEIEETANNHFKRFTNKSREGKENIT